MIIKAKRVKARGGALSRVLCHVTNGDDNDEVQLVCGNVADLQDARADALRFGREYAVRHFILSPEQDISSEQRTGLIHKLAAEFGFDATQAVVWRHRSPRAVESVSNEHFHLLCREVDAVTGAVLSSSHNYARHEKIARTVEVEWKLGGHTITRGAHNRAVLDALNADDRTDVVKALEAAGIADTPRQAESFDENDHQRLKRLGLDVPKLRVMIATALSTSRSLADFNNELTAIGLRVRAGERRDTPIVETLDGVFVGGLARLTRLRAAALKERLKFHDAERSTIAPNDPPSDVQPHSEDGEGHGPRRETGRPGSGPQSAERDDADDRSASTPDWRSGSDSSSFGGTRGPARRVGSYDGVEGSRSRLILELGCAARQVALLDMIAVARRSALPPIERAVADLNQIIEDATTCVDRPPDLPVPLTLLAARERVNAAKQRLEAWEAKVDAIESRLRNSPALTPLRRWMHPQEAADRGRLEHDLKSQQRRVQKASSKLSSAQFRLKHEEASYNTARKHHQAEVAWRSRDAGPRIKTAEVARAFATRNRRIAAWGANRLMQVANGIQQARMIRADHTMTDNWSFVGITDIWGIPIPPPPPKVF